MPWSMRKPLENVKEMLSDFKNNHYYLVEDRLRFNILFDEKHRNCANDKIE